MLAVYVFGKALFIGTNVPGWASVAFMLAFFNGMTLLVLGVVGEYVVRILTEMSRTDPYHVIETTRSDAD
jgi:hypothetical protein